MTKPVQIPYRPIIAKAALDIERNWCDCNMRSVDDRYAAISGIIQQASDAESQAALLQVRSLLEAKAKEWQQPGMYFGVGKDYQAAVEGAYKGCADYLLSLAATLGNQGK